MRVAAKNGHRRKNGGKENKRNTNTDDAILDENRRKTGRTGSTVGGRGATSYI